MSELEAIELQESYAEAPVLTDISMYGVSFIFDIPLGRMDDKKHFRLEPLLDKLQSQEKALYRDLVLPTDSFVTDIAQGEGAWRRRPLMLAVERAPAANDRRNLTLVRPAEFTYEAEGRAVTLKTTACERSFGFRDALVVCASGRLIYVFTLIPSAGGAGIDEYVLLQFQKLVNPTEQTGSLRGALKFKTAGGNEATLVDFLAARLDALSHDASRPNAIRNLVPYLLGHGERLPKLEWRDLRSLMIAIESESLLNAILHAPKAGLTVDVVEGRSPTHMPADVPPATRQLLVLAGLVQGVADFPFQDGNEIEDSLETTFDSESFAAFSHPAFLVEIQSNWRSLRRMQDTLGTCPYLLLTQCVVLHNVILIEESEADIEALLYGANPKEVRIEPLENLERIVNINLFGVLTLFGISSAESALTKNLKRRLSIHRRLNAGWIPNLFRYRMERELLMAIFKARSLGDRHDAAIQLLDQYHSVTSDAYGLIQSKTARISSSVLFIIAMLGAIKIVSDSISFFDKLFNGQ